MEPILSILISSTKEEVTYSRADIRQLGSDNFVESIKDKYMDLHKGERNVPALKALKKSPDIEGIYNELKLHFNNDNAFSRKATIYLFHTYSDKPLMEIGEFFGIGESGVSDVSRRLGILLMKNRKLRKEIELIHNKLNFWNA